MLAAVLLLLGGMLVGAGAVLTNAPASSEPTLLTGEEAPDRVVVPVQADEPPDDRDDRFDRGSHDAEATRFARTAARPSGVGERTPAEEAAPAPIVLEIPTVGIRADVIDLGLDDDGRLEVPEDFDEVGWWTGGPAPGEDGPAVLAGHVDSYEGPAVFWRLRELAPGDEVVVHRADGSARTFVVDGLGRWPKDDFPTDLVYREADGPELRLITCGGVFDEDVRSYRDNVIVFATAR